MRLRLAALSLLIATFIGGCAHQPAQTPAATGHGAITLTIAPNPIIAQPVAGSTTNLYEFPFDVVVRETGGHAVTINSVTMNVYAFGLQVNYDKYDAAQIDAMGIRRDVAANGEWRYHLQPRRAVTDERLFSSVTASVRVDATDDTGAATSASVRVTVTR